DDMVNVFTRWLRRGRPRWKLRLLLPYTKQVLAQQWVWLDYRKLGELPQRLAANATRWAGSDEAAVICYRSELQLEQAAVGQDELRERLTLDCEALCEMIKVSRDRLFVAGEGAVQVHAIERQQDYDLLLVQRQPGEAWTSAQRW